MSVDTERLNGILMDLDCKINEFNGVDDIIDREHLKRAINVLDNIEPVIQKLERIMIDMNPMDIVLILDMQECIKILCGVINEKKS